MTWYRRLLDWIGGSVSRTAGTGLFGGLLFVIFGMTPAELVAYLLQHPPAWLMSGWTRLLLVILGLALLFASVRFNVWSERQKMVDSLAEDISWAIKNLVNRPRPALPQALPQFTQQWDADYREWCEKVSKKLENRAFFSRADQLHFDRLGLFPTVHHTGIPQLDWLMSQLREKFDRLRDIINWVQQRSR